ncbi:peptide-methionine (S)-S-oxide reductase MsrA [Methanogenium organophilum]|uniref:Peptide methionine sulfoxide reductase MsrA n=1 Tax=Methanogenium organophilum TaxID=2199 RepID=A0A9X9T9C6_METOG|nr:peptide-methionine (S)-S-oxide reductase MsrA [Methanogenium organophilum]WAI02500.1 peptide-methionine (S)-S-oxide reductase MsrA [Methanogenium organophilum]
METNAGTEEMEICQITLAGGCFREIEAGLRKIPGILATVVGYTGGGEENPDYIRVSTGETGHVEAVRIAYDPTVIPLSDILDRFFCLYDPTVKEPETGSEGSQYRSAVFCHTEEDCRTTRAFIHAEEKSGNYCGPIVTEVRTAATFWPAEDCHQQYYEKMANRYRKPLF